VPVEPAGYHHVYHQYTVRVADGRRDALQAFLADAGIGTGVYYPIAAHQQPVYLDRGYRVSLPVTEQAAREVLSLPVHPSVDDQDLACIVERVHAFQQAGA
jgi:dTDP-4-amino-4,6-dideoxygalactose transaminase